MPIISRFFGIVIRMFFDDHNPPHIHVEYQSGKAVIDFNGNVLKGDLGSKTALKLVREWVDLHEEELLIDWDAAVRKEPLNEIPPLD